MSTGTGTCAAVQSDFAKRQLERMGWKQGNGLGKDRQGRAAPIIVKQRSDVTGGLGIEKEKVRQVQQTIQDEWWKDALGDTLSKLCDKKEKKKKRKRGTIADSKNSEEHTNTETIQRKKVFTDEELFIATGGARFGMRAGKTRNQAKWRRTEDLETEVIVQQQHQPQHQNRADIVTHSNTTATTSGENQTAQGVNVETQIVDGEDVSDQKSKSKKSKRDKKTRNEKQTSGAIDQSSMNADCTTGNNSSATPPQQEKRKKKKKSELLPWNRKCSMQHTSMPL